MSDATWKGLRRALVSTSSRTIWIGLASVLAVAVGVSAYRSHEHASSASGLITGRIWIDHLPQKDTEHFEVFVAMDEGSLGLFQRSSAYEGAFEVFKHEPRGEGKIQMLFPQTKKKVDVKYEATNCKEKDFDYCLKLTGAPRGASSYVSKRGWEIEGADPAAIERAVLAWEKQLELETDSAGAE
jgi:hypothetical protein